MRRSEMSAEELQLRSTIRTFLDKRSWDFADTSWFEDDLWAAHELSPFFDNGRMLIELELSLANKSLNLILSDHQSGDELFMVLNSEHDLLLLFKTIDALKENIHSENYRLCLEPLLSLADSVVVD